MKVDLDKIKAEYEHKIQEAIVVNGILDKIGDDSFRVHYFKARSNKRKDMISFNAEKVLEELPIEKVGLILTKLPSTEKIEVYVGNYKHEMMDYRLLTRRGYRDAHATLDISYISGDYEISISLPIEPNKELNGFFADTTRKVEQSEITTYYIVNRPDRKAEDVRVPMNVFANGEYVRFVGGYVTNKSEWAANNIVEAIKEAYTKSIHANQ